MFDIFNMLKKEEHKDAKPVSYTHLLRPHGGGTGRSQRFWRTVPPGARADGGSISSKNYLFDELTKNNRKKFMQKHLCPDGLWCMIRAMQCWIQQMRMESENRTQ